MKSNEGGREAFILSFLSPKKSDEGSKPDKLIEVLFRFNLIDMVVKLGNEASTR